MDFKRLKQTKKPMNIWKRYWVYRIYWTWKTIRYVNGVEEKLINDPGSLYLEQRHQQRQD